MHLIRTLLDSNMFIFKTKNLPVVVGGTVEVLGGAVVEGGIAVVAFGAPVDVGAGGVVGDTGMEVCKMVVIDVATIKSNINV